MPGCLVQTQQEGLLKACNGRLGLYTRVLSADAHGAANMFIGPLLLHTHSHWIQASCQAPSSTSNLVKCITFRQQTLQIQPVLMLQERAKQAKQAAMQAELAELKAVLHTKQATVQALRTSHMRAQVWLLGALWLDNNVVACISVTHQSHTCVLCVPAQSAWHLGNGSGVHVKTDMANQVPYN